MTQHPAGPRSGGARRRSRVKEKPRPHEGIATTGDSGGAVFYDNGSQWELAGILFAISLLGGQPPSTSIYGNVTHMVDLAVYRDEILDVIALPEPGGGLWWGAVALLGLFQRRHRR